MQLRFEQPDFVTCFGWPLQLPTPERFARSADAGLCQSYVRHSSSRAVLRDALLLKRFLSQCSRSGSAETVQRLQARAARVHALADQPRTTVRDQRRSASTWCPTAGTSRGGTMKLNLHPRIADFKLYRWASASFHKWSNSPVPTRVLQAPKATRALEGVATLLAVIR